MPIRVGCHDFNWIPYASKRGETLDLERVLAELVQAGYEAVEFSAVPFETDDPARTAELLRKYGLELTGMSFSYRGEENALEILKGRARLLAEWGGRVGVFLDGSGRRRKRELTEDDFREIGQLAGAVAEYAASLGLDTVVHNHLGTIVESTHDLDRFLKYAPACGLCLDTGHLIPKGENPADAVRRYRDILRHVHFKDTGLKPDGTFEEFVDLGTGNHRYSLEGVLRELKTVRYDGWLVVEQDHTRSTPLLSARADRDYLKKHGF